MGFLNALYAKYGIILDEEILHGTEGVNGLAVGRDGKPPIVALKPGMGNHQKQFVMAHEMGHVLMGHLDARLGTLGDTRCESEANMFAAALLAVALVTGRLGEEAE